jgi:ribosome biogenesis GTPase
MNEVLASWGFDAHFEAKWQRAASDELEPARVIAEFRGGTVVASAHGELKAVTSGRLRRAVKVDQADKPAVGDWVAVRVTGRLAPAAAEGAERAGAPMNEGQAMIHGVVPRRTCVVRRASGRDALPQVVAANVDVVIIATSLAGEVNPRRLERYLAVVRESGARAVLAHTKAHIAPDPTAALAQVAAIAGDAPVHVLSSLTGAGVEVLDACFAGNATVALVGSSGVGKSTLINRWLGRERQTTKTVGDDGRGRHATTHRELFLRPGGGLVMDTPGMRELGLWEADEGVRDTFADVSEVAASCRFRDCKHVGEPGCAVSAALAAGTLARDRFDAWTKLAEELATNSADAARLRKRHEKVSTRALEKLTRGRGDD